MGEMPRCHLLPEPCQAASASCPELSQQGVWHRQGLISVHPIWVSRRSLHMYTGELHTICCLSFSCVPQNKRQLELQTSSGNPLPAFRNS